MKTRKITYLTAAIIIGILFTGCGDSFFDHTPTGSIVQDNFYQTEQDLFMATGSLYNHVWFDFNDKIKIEMGDGAGGTMWTGDGARREFVEFRVNSAHPRLNEMWRSLYIVINQANTHIANIDERAPAAGIDRVVINHRVAEARFMRADRKSVV